MSSGQILFLGAVAGFTIFLGLPVGRMQSVSLGVKSFLSAMATGILIFLFWDVMTAAVEPIEGALTEGNDGRFLWLAALLTCGFTVGLLTLDTLWQAVLPPVWYLLLHNLEANLITPVLLGRRFTLNPVVIFVSLIFWTWLWGVPGALLSVPILVSIKVVCDRVPAMSFVSELLSR